MWPRHRFLPGNFSNSFDQAAQITDESSATRRERMPQMTAEQSTAGPAEAPTRLRAEGVEAVPRPRRSRGQDWKQSPLYDAAATGLRGYWYPLELSSKVEGKPTQYTLCGEKLFL